MNDFGTKLKTILAERGIDQLEVCEATGISTGSMSNYIRGKRNPKIETRIKIAKYFGVPLSYFDDGMSGLSVEEEVANYFISQPDRSAKELSYEILDIIKASGIIDTTAPLTDETRELVRKIAKKATELVLLTLKDS